MDAEVAVNSSMVQAFGLPTFKRQRPGASARPSVPERLVASLRKAYSLLAEGRAPFAIVLPTAPGSVLLSEGAGTTKSSNAIVSVVLAPTFNGTRLAAPTASVWCTTESAGSKPLEVLPNAFETAAAIAIHGGSTAKPFLAVEAAPAGVGGNGNSLSQARSLLSAVARSCAQLSAVAAAQTTQPIASVVGRGGPSTLLMSTSPSSGSTASSNSTVLFVHSCGRAGRSSKGTGAAAFKVLAVDLCSAAQLDSLARVMATSAPPPTALLKGLSLTSSPQRQGQAAGSVADDVLSRSAVGALDGLSPSKPMGIGSKGGVTANLMMPSSPSPGKAAGAGAAASAAHARRSMAVLPSSKAAPLTSSTSVAVSSSSSSSIPLKQALETLGLLFASSCDADTVESSSTSSSLEVGTDMTPALALLFSSSSSPFAGPGLPVASSPSSAVPIGLSFDPKNAGGVVSVVLSSQSSSSAKDIDINALPCDPHFLAVALRCVYEDRQDPYFSLDPADPRNPQGDFVKKVFRPQWLAGTCFGETLFAADFALKMHALGKWRIDDDDSASAGSSAGPGDGGLESAMDLGVQTYKHWLEATQPLGPPGAPAGAGAGASLGAVPLQDPTKTRHARVWFSLKHLTAAYDSQLCRLSLPRGDACVQLQVDARETRPDPTSPTGLSDLPVSDPSSPVCRFASLCNDSLPDFLASLPIYGRLCEMARALAVAKALYALGVPISKSFLRLWTAPMIPISPSSSAHLLVPVTRISKEWKEEATFEEDADVVTDPRTGQPVIVDPSNPSSRPMAGAAGAGMKPQALKPTRQRIKRTVTRTCAYKMFGGVTLTADLTWEQPAAPSASKPKAAAKAAGGTSVARPVAKAASAVPALAAAAAPASRASVRTGGGGVPVRVAPTSGAVSTARKPEGKEGKEADDDATVSEAGSLELNDGDEEDNLSLASVSRRPTLTSDGPPGGAPWSLLQGQAVVDREFLVVTPPPSLAGGSSDAGAAAPVPALSAAPLLSSGAMKKASSDPFASGHGSGDNHIPFPGVPTQRVCANPACKGPLLWNSVLIEDASCGDAGASVYCTRPRCSVGTQLLELLQKYEAAQRTSGAAAAGGSKAGSKSTAPQTTATLKLAGGGGERTVSLPDISRISIPQCYACGAKFKPGQVYLTLATDEVGMVCLHSAKDGHGCLRCQVKGCGASLIQGGSSGSAAASMPSLRVNRGLLLCPRHAAAEDGLAVPCAGGCGKELWQDPVTGASSNGGRWLTLGDGAKYHEGCFKCCGCRKTISGSYYTLPPPASDVKGSADVTTYRCAACGPPTAAPAPSSSSGAGRVPVTTGRR